MFVNIAFSTVPYIGSHGHGILDRQISKNINKCRPMIRIRLLPGPLTISLNVVARSGHVLEIFENRTLSNPDKIAQNLQNVVVNNRTDFANTSKVVVKNGHTENWQKKCKEWSCRHLIRVQPLRPFRFSSTIIGYNLNSHANPPCCLLLLLVYQN
jgi:hypothetical protein